MDILNIRKDGGPESKVKGLFIIAIKKLFSVVILHFADGSRDAYHSHAFNCVSWVLKGNLTENMKDGRVREYLPSLKPVITRREDFHKVVSTGDTYVLSFRGPWKDTWHEYIPETKENITLTHGRKIV